MDYDYHISTSYQSSICIHMKNRNWSRTKWFRPPIYTLLYK